jgi:hypothetical protein
MPDQRSGNAQLPPSEDAVFRRALRTAEERNQAEEEQAHSTYTEPGVVGEKREEQAFKEAVARGELTRGEREMAHGEFGPKAYTGQDESTRPANNP